MLFRRKKKEAEEKTLSESDRSKRESVNSLSPHPLQQMPKFFDADVIYYNPDSPNLAVRNTPGRHLPKLPKNEHNFTFSSIKKTNRKSIYLFSKIHDIKFLKI